MNDNQSSITRESGTKTRLRVPVPVATRDNAPKVDVLKKDGIVQAIRVSCACGSSVDIKCDYSNSTPTTQETS
jgi:hypothetical protein